MRIARVHKIASVALNCNLTAFGCIMAQLCGGGGNGGGNGGGDGGGGGGAEAIEPTSARFSFSLFVEPATFLPKTFAAAMGFC